MPRRRGSPASTIEANIGLTTGQSWTNNSANLLTFSGLIANGANALTIDGGGIARTINAAAVGDRVMQVPSGAETLKLDNIALTAGSAAGGGGCSVRASELSGGAGGRRARC